MFCDLPLEKHKKKKKLSKVCKLRFVVLTAHAIISEHVSSKWNDFIREIYHFLFVSKESFNLISETKRAALFVFAKPMHVLFGVNNFWCAICKIAVCDEMDHNILTNFWMEWTTILWRIEIR